MRKLILMLCLVLGYIGVKAQNYDFIIDGQKAQKAGGKELADFKAKLATLSKSSKETDMLDATMGYYGLNDATSAREVTEAAKKKFPNGIAMRSAELQKLSAISNAAEMEKAYKKWLKRFPEKKLGNNENVYEQGAYFVLEAYAKEGNADKALEYVHSVANPEWKSISYFTAGRTLQTAGKNDLAGQVLKEGNDYADKVIPSLTEREQNRASMVYGAYADWLANNGKADEAWQLYNTKVRGKSQSEAYWKLALQHGLTMQTWTHYDALLRSGNIDKAGTDIMQKAWTKANGNADGFDEYVKAANEKRIDDKLAKIPDQMINKPAPDFTLNDINGNTVQLSKLRGKVVVIDFWATWCGPCKRSLPAMKMAVEKYKNDSDVVFLFIHTWERGTAEQADKDAKAYLHDNGYDEFHLVMDTKDPETKINKAVTAFDVKGIPAKFVIDKHGNIRFQLTGFSGSNDDAVAELSEMIDLAKKQ